MKFSEIFNINPIQFVKNASVQKNIINSFYYFGGPFLQFLIAIFTQPIYARYLELHDFAIIGYYDAIRMFLVPLFSMNLADVLLGNVLEKRMKKIIQRKIYLFILNFLNIVNIIIALISFLIISLYFHLFHVIFPLLPFLVIIIANLYFEKYKTFYLLECRIEKAGLKYFLLSSLQILMTTSFSLYFLISLHGGAVGRMSGIMLSGIITGTVALLFFLKKKKYNFSLKFDKKKVKSALKYCLPLIIGSYAYYPIDNIDRLFLERLGNTSEYGYYTIGLSIAGFAATFFLAVYRSIEPDLYKFITQKKYKEYMIFTFSYITVLALLCIVFIFSSKIVVSYLTSGRYTYASTYANLFIIGIFFMLVGGIFEQLFTAYGATKLDMFRNILTGIFCIIAYYFMIQEYQFYGASVTRIMTSVFFVLTGAVIFFLFIRKKKNEID